MIGLRLENGETVKANFDKAVSLVIPTATKTLDDLAWIARSRMMVEAPKHRGNLATHIEISNPAPNIRVIEPAARNRSGRKYASAVETGTKTYASLPNLANLAEDYGLSLFVNNQLNPIVVAMARTIKERGTPANPFVARTLAWVTGYIKQNKGLFVDEFIKASFVSPSVLALLTGIPVSSY